MFRNESTAVITKVKARELKLSSTSSHSPFSVDFKDDTIHKSADSTLPISEYLPFDQHDPQASSVTTLMANHYLAPSTEERASAYFNATYSMKGPMHSDGSSSFDSMDTLFKPLDMDEPLVASINAVGLASFSNHIHSPELMNKALKDYVVALQLTNRALRSPKDAAKDSTLFAVLILSVFETVTGSTQQSLMAWAKHINGAATLIKFRGENQFKTYAGQRMFSEVTANLIMSCVQRQTAVPDYIIKLREGADNYFDKSNPAWRLSDVIVEFTNFQASVKNGVLVGAREIVTAALQIDSSFLAVFRDLPEIWKYTTVYTDANPELVWNGNYHVYNDYWVAQLWNSMRCCRILLHEIILKHLKADISSMAPEFDELEYSELHLSTVRAMIQMRSDILASIPQQTLSSDLQNWANSEAPRDENRHIYPMLRRSRGYFALWSLYVVGGMELGTEAIRNWVINRLNAISEEMGFRQARMLADFLYRHEEVTTFSPKQAIVDDVSILESTADDLSTSEPIASYPAEEFGGLC